MGAKDLYHETVKKSLEKEGWIITDDPLFIKFGEINLMIDLGDEKVIGAEKDDQKIAVEIKNFAGLSVVNEFQKALGQFLMYKKALEDDEPDRILFLAISNEAHKNLIKFMFFEIMIKMYSINFF
ncbi:MAG: fatty-acid oxidation protein subunit alpha [Leptospiraceae bacterium]|nr:fatty-acid oxidation protein subunit alpha [Leptospiraceae bacterium]